MKILIISHSYNTMYGAAKSLGNLLRNCDWEFDFAYPNALFGSEEEKVMEKYTNYKAQKIYKLFLPFERDTVYKHSTLLEKIEALILSPLVYRDSFKLKRIIRNGNYDYILLNSLVLYPLIENKNKYIFYVREKIVDNPRIFNKVVKKMRFAHRVIFIDKAVALPFESENIKGRVINNPFDMRSISKLDRKEVENKHPKVSCEKITIAIIGLIVDIKGVLFVIDAFNRMKRNDIQLLVVGKEGNKEYLKECEKHARNNPNICFLGEQEKIDEIYLLSDYIIRGDAFFATGRTVYEGLYADCNVILQIDTEEDKEKVHEYERFKEKLYFYQTRNMDSLVSLLNGLPSGKIVERVTKANISEYIDEVEDYIKND